MGEAWGVAAAVLSSGLGGTALAATRYVVGASDPLLVGVFRFGIGFLLLLPIALIGRSRWPARADWPGVAGLGVLFFGLFPILLNASLALTTAARGALALSTLPLLTMLVAAALRVEALTWRKSAGVAVAMAGVAMALASSLSAAPPEAPRGDALMVAAAFCMALYNVWSKPFIARSGTVSFTVVAMGCGVACLGLAAAAHGSYGAVSGFGAPQWTAMLYLGLFGGAVNFWLWSYALERTTPTRVAVSVTVNPVTASLLGAVLLGEGLRWNLVLGLLTVALGILVAVRPGRPAG